jgi:hypothetical protein
MLESGGQEREDVPDPEIGQIGDGEVVGLQRIWGACTDPSCIWSMCGDTRRRTQGAVALRLAMQAPNGEVAIAIIEVVLEQIATQNSAGE